MAETRLHSAYRRRLDGLRSGTLARVLAADTSDTEAFVRTVVPIVIAAQTATVANADGYLSAEAGMATGTSREPWGLDAGALVGVHARRGDYLEDVYARNHRAPEGTFAGRMGREVNTDITLADRAATFVHTEGDTRITGYRRVLSSGKNCGLCIVAASQRYSKGDLRPIHHTCRCTTQAIYGSGDGWRKPTRGQLLALYERAGGTTTESLRRIRVDTTDLPEVDIVDSVLGPTLVAAV